MVRLTLVIMAIVSNPRAFASGVSLDTVDASVKFLDEDFSTPIRYDYASQFSPSKCANTDDLMITGITRVTGLVSCIAKSAKACPVGTFAQGLKANVTTNPPTLEYVCRPVAKATCPTDYVWQSLDFAKLDPGPTSSPGAMDCSTVGTCVYRWANHINWQRTWPTNQHSVSGTFCNPDVYDAKASGACEAKKNFSIPGTCYYPCPPCNSGTLCSTCSYPYDPWIEAVPSGPTGADVGCTLVKHDQCGSFISGYVQWQGTCEIKKPETVAPNGACAP